jgi:Protein of unknown function (DUF2637)
MNPTPITATAAAARVLVPWQQRRSVRAGYVLILLVLVACAFIDSFAALAELAQATAALPGVRAITLPLMLDGLTLAGTLFAVTRFGPGQGSPAYGYVLIAIGSLASLAGNVAHAPATLPARIIAGAPPLILVLVFEAAAISFRRRPVATPSAGSGASSADPGAAPVGTGAASATSSAGPDASGADPALPGVEPTSKRRHAQRIYDELTATGGPVTGVRLAEAAGLSPSYARALLAEFTTAVQVEPPTGPERNGHTSPTTIMEEGSA